MWGEAHVGPLQRFVIVTTKSWRFFSECGGWDENVYQPYYYFFFAKGTSVQLTNALDTKFLCNWVLFDLWQVDQPHFKLSSFLSEPWGQAYLLFNATVWSPLFYHLFLCSYSIIQASHAALFAWFWFSWIRWSKCDWDWECTAPPHFVPHYANRLCIWNREVKYLLWIVLAVNNCELCCLLWVRLTQSVRNYAYLIDCTYWKFSRLVWTE